MATRVYPVDWRDEFAQLRPYLNGQGGVVRICYPGSCCASSFFLETLKWEYECKDDNLNWKSIRIDHSVYSVRYLVEIVREFERIMRIKFEQSVQPPAGDARLNILSGVEARDVKATISDVTLHVGGDDPNLSADRRDTAIASMCGHLRAFLESGRMMVVVNHGTASDQDELWRYLWRDRLEALTGAGLLLVHMVDVSDAHGGVHALAPAPHMELNLPTALGLGAQADAIEDLAKIVVRIVPRVTAEEARLRADTLVRTHVNDLVRLHSQYSKLLMELARERS